MSGSVMSIGGRMEAEEVVEEGVVAAMVANDGEVLVKDVDDVDDVE